jgi:hypothetical protein
MTTETGTITTSLGGVSQALSGYTQVAFVPAYGGVQPAFSAPEDIGNRALQHLGQSRMLSFNDNSKAAASIRFCYDKLRSAELRRNTWTFSTRRTVIRAVSLTTRQWQAPEWVATTNFPTGSIVEYEDTCGRTLLWISQSQININQVPTANASPWQQYFGPVVADLWNVQNQTPPQAYLVGDLAYLNPQLGYYNVYISLINSNTDTPGTTANWQFLGGWTAPLNIMYPAEVGPISDTFTKNMFQLPCGYLRKCNQDPKAGSTSLLGAPTNARYLDWQIESGYIISQDPNPIILRFVADVQDVTQMDPMFCEGLGCRIGLEVCEEITQAQDRLAAMNRFYMKMMTEARLVNAIEGDSEESPLDDWIDCQK